MLALWLVSAGCGTDQEPSPPGFLDLTMAIGEPCSTTEVDGEVVGWVHVVESTSLQSGTLVEIRGLVVAASARRTGVGRALVAAAEAWAVRRGHEVLRVRTDVRRDDARAFYLGVGYEERKRQVLLTRQLR